MRIFWIWINLRKKKSNKNKISCCGCIACRNNPHKHCIWNKVKEADKIKNRELISLEFRRVCDIQRREEPQWWRRPRWRWWRLARGTEWFSTGYHATKNRLFLNGFVSFFILIDDRILPLEGDIWQPWSDRKQWQ